MKRQSKMFPRCLKHCWMAGALILAAALAPSASAQTLAGQARSIFNTQEAPFVGFGQASLVENTAQEAGKKDDKTLDVQPQLVEGGPPAVNTGCATCGLGGGGCCVPGRYRECCGCNSDSICGRILCCFYDELCCPDPCYEGKWLPVANAAFFVEGTRPVTTTRIRWDYGANFTLPDRAEFFWAGSGGTGGGKGPAAKETSLNYSQLSLYQEIAAKGFSAFIDIPYLAVDPEVNPFAAGFGDMKIGTKSLLFDRDLFQLGFMFQTYLPVGNFSKGLGTGHVSLEPSILATLKLTPDTYMQGQLSEWVPLGSDPGFQGSIFHYHFSLNHVLCRPVEDVQLIGTAEFVGYSFQAGLYSDPASGLFVTANDTSYFTLGPGLRLVICDWLDFGFGAAFNLTDHGPGQTYRTEMRIRY